MNSRHRGARNRWRPTVGVEGPPRESCLNFTPTSQLCLVRRRQLPAYDTPEWLAGIILLSNTER